MLQNILEKVFITKKYTQCKGLHTLNIDLFKIPDKIKILENSLENLNSLNSSYDLS